MKFAVSQLTYLLTDATVRRNLRGLLKYLGFLLLVIVLNSAAFQLIMTRLEGEPHSWITAVYWTLTTMSTLGFGDITFDTDVGRAFSTLVLMSGIVLLLIVLPFTFIRFFYAPWLEARIRMQAPREVAEGTRGHVILCRNDELAPGLAEKFRGGGIPYFVVEPDPARAVSLHQDGVSVVLGDVESRATWEALRVGQARLVLANASDTVNTNIVLTVREISQDVTVAALAENHDSVDILELSGASRVIPLKYWLGEQLANRVPAGRSRAHPVGRFRELVIVELPVHNTFLSGRRVHEVGLRADYGLSVAGIWVRGHLEPVRPDTVLHDDGVLVLVGTDAAVEKINRALARHKPDEYPVVVLGGGKVGCAAADALKRRGVTVHLVERDESLRRMIEKIPDRLIVGDAADREVLEEAGLMEAPSVVLSTSDDAMNIYLALYCRRLNPKARIISRITHDRNLEAIHRAGADFVLSHASLGVGVVVSLLQGTEPVILGEGVDVFFLDLPPSLHGLSLAESGIGAITGLNVIALQADGRLNLETSPHTRLEPGGRLLVVGTPSQREAFLATYA
jgi:voltage-gated potassium channel